MNYWQFLLIQLNFVIFYIIYCWLSKRTTLFKFNRIYLLLAPILAIYLPLVSLLQFSHQPVNQRFMLDEISITLQPLITTSTTSVTSTNLLIWLGITISLLLFLFSLRSIILFQKDEKLMDLGKIKVYRTSKSQSFSFYNSIYINDLNAGNLDLIIQHELAHCYQKHSFDLLYFAIIKSLFWFNPMVYLWNKKIKENHEFLADDAVITSSQNVKEYSQTLLIAHLEGSYPKLGAGFHSPSLLAKRIQKMKHKNKSYMKHVILLPLLASTLWVTTSLSSLTAVKSDKAIVQAVKTDATEPEFPGGQEALMQYIAQSIIYPPTSIEKKEKGIVYIEFTILKTGEVANPTILRSSGYQALDNEAIRVIGNMPKWNPAKDGETTVDGKLQLPIRFTFQND